MNKTQLVDALAARLGDRRTASSAVDGLLEIIVDTVGSGSSVTLTGFGVFEPRARAARVARNPRTGETVPVPATTVPAFRPGTAFKATVEANGAGAAKPAPARRTSSTAARTAAPRTAARRGRAAAASDAAPTPAVVEASAKPAVAEAPAKPARRAAKSSGSFSAPAEAPAEKPARKAAKKAEPKKAEPKKAAPKAKEPKEAKAAAKPAKKTPAKGKAKK
jgi:DNA-binding protein HU-beta